MSTLTYQQNRKTEQTPTICNALDNLNLCGDKAVDGDEKSENGNDLNEIKKRPSCNYIIYRVINSDITETQLNENKGIEIKECKELEQKCEDVNIEVSDGNAEKLSNEDSYKEERREARRKKLVDTLTEKWSNDLYQEQNQQPRKQNGKIDCGKPPPIIPRGSYWGHDNRFEESTSENTSDEHNNKEEAERNRPSLKNCRTNERWKHDLYREVES